MSCDACITEDVNHEAINNQFKIIFVLIRLCNRLKLHLKTHGNSEEGCENTHNKRKAESQWK